MAARKRYFQDLWRELRSPDPSLNPAYLIYGPEELLARRAVDRIIELCGQVEPFDHVRYAGNDVEIMQLAEELTTLPMMAERRVIYVHMAEKLLQKVGRGARSKEAEFLRSAIKENAESSCLVLRTSPELSLGALPGRSIHPSFACYGVYPLSEQKLVAWIARGTQDRGLTLHQGAAARLISAVGTSLIDIENELDKLAVFLGDGGRVTAEAIDELVGEKGVSLLEFLDTVARRDIPAALTALDTLLLIPRNAYRIIPALVGLFMEIHSALTLSPDDLAGIIPKWRVREVSSWSRNWSHDQVLTAIDALFQAEYRLKSGFCRTESALIQFLTELVYSGTGD